jgi:chorismate synthase
MNSLGNLFKVQIFGESHGPLVGVIIDGCPAGLEIKTEDFLDDLERRKGGIQKGSTPRQEEDLPLIQSGVFNNYSTGFPISILFENKNIRSADYDKQRSIPRPGHADWVAHQKFGGFEDYRGGGHFSARLTTGIVAAGVIAKKLLSEIKVVAKIIEVGGETDLDKGLQKAIEANDSVGAVVECRIDGLPAGLGEPYFYSLESMLSQILFSIPAVRGIEFGTGFAAARMFGSEHNDRILDKDGHTETNHAGGIVGGISNGNQLIFRLAFKPTSSTPKEQESLNWESGELEKFNIKGRHDLCVALRAPVIVEAASAIVLADAMLMAQKLKKVLIP